MTDMQSFKEALRERGFKATPQRLAVHGAMMELGHASADMVADYIASKGENRITVATIYNILSQLALAGIYKHRMSPTNKMFFDVNNSRHIHLYDVRNGEFRDIVDDELCEYVEDHFRHRRFKGYKVDDIEIQLVCHPTRKTLGK